MSHAWLTNSIFTTEITDTGKAKQKETSENMDSAGKMVNDVKWYCNIWGSSI